MPLEFEIDKLPFTPAMYSRESFGTRKIRLIVIHSMEFPEKGDTAESCAKYFQNRCDEQGVPRPSAAHLCVDCDSGFLIEGQAHPGFEIQFSSGGKS